MFSGTKILFCYTLLIFLGIQVVCFPQAHNEKGILWISGLVSGYNQETSRKLFQKEKPIVLEGTLESVSINVFEGGKQLNTVYTNKKGEFELKLNLGTIYKIELLRSGHARSLFLIDVKSVPAEIAERGLRFSWLELVLNSFQSSDTSHLNQPFGRLYYNERKKMMDYEPAMIKVKTGLFSSSEEPDISFSLMRRAVLKNKDNVINETSAAENSAKEQKMIQKKFSPKPAISVSPKDSTPEGSPDTSLFRTAVSGAISDFKLSPNAGIESLSEKNIFLRESEIRQAQAQLEKDKKNATGSQDSLILKEREYILNAAVLELRDAKKMIEMQKSKISTQRVQLTLAVCGLALLFSLLFIIYKQFAEKKKTNVILEEQNHKITDSINYAKHIQQSILPQENEIKKLLPESFIYYQPRDIVSGDFYWCSEIGNKIIIAAIDCTGHGVPGAFMSLIGNTLLNEIINEKNILQPSAILKSLHLGILNSLHQNAGELSSQDGMEMSLCVIDPPGRMIEFAGAMNPIYLIKDRVLSSVKPDIQAIGGINTGFRKLNTVEFTDQKIPIQKDMTLYLFTDGYMDQFGGPENKKFNSARFKQLLLDIQDQGMEKQKQSIENTIVKWKGRYRQVDDMLVIGIKF